jgi:hypothetical protein
MRSTYRVAQAKARTDAFGVLLWHGKPGSRYNLGEKEVPMRIIVSIVLATTVMSGDAQDAAVKAIEKFGGTVIPTEDGVRIWVLERVTPEQLQPLHDVKDFKELCLQGTFVTDKVVDKLRGLKIEVLDLWGAKITDHGIKPLK